MKRLSLLLLALAVAGCTSRKPRVERDPGRYAPAETEARKVSRLEERIHAAQDQVNGWLRELETGRGHAKDESALDAATERLRAVRQSLDELRLRANDVEKRGGESEDLEKEAIRLETAGERAYRDGLAAIGKTPETPAR